MLPYVVLKGAGVAIGRGKEALWAIGGTSSSASAHGTPRTCLASGNDKHLTEVLKRNLGFVEVADGRVSRLHCIISLGASGGGSTVLEDCSSNGTFLNHRKLAKGESGGCGGGCVRGAGSSLGVCLEEGGQGAREERRVGDMEVVMGSRSLSEVGVVVLSNELIAMAELPLDFMVGCARGTERQRGRGYNSRSG